MANPPKREKDSSLPPSLIPHLFSGPQQRQGSSPTGSTGTQEEAELPASTFEPRPTASPLRPLVPSPLPPLPVPFPDTRRQYPAYESGVHTDPVILHPPAGPLPIPERPGGPSSIPHGSARGYRIPVISDPTYPTPVRLQGPVYLGSHSLPPVLPQTTLARTHWREGEAGPSSLVQSHPYGGISRQRNPSYPPPQPIYRRATEPGGYSTPPSHIQPPLHSSYERLRLQEPPLGGYPPRPPSENPYAEAAQSTLSLPPLYTREDWPYGVPGNVREQGDLPPLYSAIQSQSPASSDYTRIGDGDYHPGQHRKADHDEFESNPRQTKIQKKILVACNFCRGRKLRCDGVKPTCCNCVSRGITCAYVLQPKRRGPGKAAKGARAKKRVSKAGRSSEPGAQTGPSFANPDFKFDFQGPEFPTRGSDSGVHSSSSQSGGGRYASQQPSPEGTPQERRPSRSRKRGPSSEHSPPPRDSEPKR